METHSGHTGFYASPGRSDCCCPQPESAQQAEQVNPESTLNSSNFLFLSSWILLSCLDSSQPLPVHQFCRLSAFCWVAASWKGWGWPAASPHLLVSNREQSSKSDAVTLLHLVLYRGKTQRKQCNSKMWTIIPLPWGKQLLAHTKQLWIATGNGTVKTHVF